jgi:hypothetical protein
MTWQGPTGGSGKVGMFIPATLYNFDWGQTLGDWSGAGNGGGVSLGRYGFVVPSDFSSLDTLGILVFSNTTQTLTFTIDTDYGAHGEAYNTHSSNITGGTLAITANQYSLINLSSLVGSLAAGDRCGVGLNMTGKTGTVMWPGLILIYNRS